MKEWFKHDYGSRNDMKLSILRSKHGLSGIGAYWCLVELLHEEGEVDADLIVFAIGDGCTQEIIDSMENLQLINRENSYYHIPRITEQREKVRDIKNKRADAGSKGGKAIAKQMLSKSEANNKQSRVEKRRVEKKEIDTNVSMSASADRDGEFMNEFDQFILWLNRSGIFQQEKKHNDKSYRKWKTRRQKFSARQISQSFANLVNEPDRWKIENNGHRPLSWWLHSDERIEDMMNCHLKKTFKSKGVIITS